MAVSSMSLWTRVHLERSGQPRSCCLVYLVFIHLCHVTLGPVDAACCSSFIQSVLTGWVCVHLGRSPGCLLLHWDGIRSPQTQFEIIKRLLVEIWDVWSHARLTPSFIPTEAAGFSEPLPGFSTSHLFWNTPTSIRAPPPQCLLCLHAPTSTLSASNVPLWSEVIPSLVSLLLSSCCRWFESFVYRR